MRIPVTRGEPSNPAQARAEAEHAQSRPESAAVTSDAPWAKRGLSRTERGEECAARKTLPCHRHLASRPRSSSALNRN